MTETRHKIRIVLERMQTNWPDASMSQAGTSIATQRLGRLLQRTAQDGLKETDLTFTEFEVLSALRAQAPPYVLTPSELYDAMLISSGGLTKVLMGLETRGLVRRSKNTNDGRSRPVELSEKGCDVAECAMRNVQSAERPIMEAMEEVRASEVALWDMLVTLAEAAEGSVEGADTGIQSDRQAN